MEAIAVNVASFDAAFPRFGCPTPVGEYTVDEQRTIHPGRAQARYLYTPLMRKKNVRFDLSVGHDRFKEKNGDEKLDVLLQWISHLCTPGSRSLLKKVLHESDFVCWRGLLTRIAATPFCERDDWQFVARRVAGVTFLCEQKTEAQMHRLATMSARDKLMTYWGFKFEQYATTDNPLEQPDTSAAVSQLEEFAVVVKSELVGPRGRTMRLLYSGEVDAVTDGGELVELKTQRHALEGGFWRQKSLKWWLQSFLLGIRRIVVGFRDDSGIVHKVDAVRVEDIPKGGQWKGNVSFNFLAAILDKVNELLERQTEGNQEPSCIVTYCPSKRIVTMEQGGEDFLAANFRHHFGLE